MNYPESVISKIRPQSKTASRGVFFVERRSHPRVRIETPFDYSLIENGKVHRGIAADASEGGLLVHLVESIELGALLSIEILFAKDRELTTIHAIAKVIWSDLAAKECWAEYCYGLQFLSFLKGDLNKLKSILHEVGRKRRN
jgi:c-di-GMP-binding flagellar brake protein YcgR